MKPPEGMTIERSWVSGKTVHFIVKVTESYARRLARNVKPTET